MKLALKLPILLFLFILAFYFMNINNVYAGIGANVTPIQRDENTDGVTITFTNINMVGSTVYLCLKGDGHCPANNNPLIPITVPDNNTVSIQACAKSNTDLKQGMCGPSDFFWWSKYDVWLYPNNVMNNTCNNNLFGSDKCMETDNAIANAYFDINKFFPKPIVTQDPSTKEVHFNLNGTRRISTNNQQNSYDFQLYQGKLKLTGYNRQENQWQVFADTNSFHGDANFGKLASDDYTLKYDESDLGYGGYNFPDITFTIDSSGNLTNVSTGSNSSGLGSGKNPCGDKCITSFGPISTNLKDFSTNILTLATGIAGGIAFILMVVGGIRVLVSQGDPKALAGGREMIIAAIAGLLFLIFSVLLLRFVGINLLGGISGI